MGGGYGKGHERSRWRGLWTGHKSRQAVGLGQESSGLGHCGISRTGGFWVQTWVSDRIYEMDLIRCGVAA